MNEVLNITPQTIRTYPISQLTQLARRIREKIIDTTLLCGGHLAPSLGVVELTIALHYVFDTPNDKIIWDVGHQAYAHKLCTGRWSRFETLRTLGGIAGFPRTAESEYDVFNTGHSGNSISVALGIVAANRLQGISQKVIAVIGDGSIVTGMAFEALNNAGASKEDLIVVLNDNEFSIGQTTGAMARYLNRIITGKIYNRFKADTWNLLGMLPKNLSHKARIAARKLESGLKNLLAPSIIFEELGFRYLGPFDGHNLGLLIEQFQKIKLMRGPLLVHIITKKGKGYAPAEKEPEKYHGIAPQINLLAKNQNLKVKTNVAEELTESKYNIALNTDAKGKINEQKAESLDIKNFLNQGMNEVFGRILCQLAQEDQRIVAISAGMCLGTGLSEFKNQFPERFFDVGICEQHAVTFAAGLALAGLKPVVAIYSTFLCRAYDQIIQDVALQNLPVVFSIDRAGIVGEDGETHQGMFDLSYLRAIPNLVIMAPADAQELSLMLEFCLNYNRPCAIRYPKISAAFGHLPINPSPIKLGKGETIFTTASSGCANKQPKRNLTVLAIGPMVLNAYQAIQMLITENPKLTDKWNITLVNMRFVKPIDKELVLTWAQNSEVLITIEENTLCGGFGSAILETINEINKINCGLDSANLNNYPKCLTELKQKETSQNQPISVSNNIKCSESKNQILENKKELLQNSPMMCEPQNQVSEKKREFAPNSSILREPINQMKKITLPTKFFMWGLPDKFITHGSREELLDECGLSVVKLKEKLVQILVNLEN